MTSTEDHWQSWIKLLHRLLLHLTRQQKDQGSVLRLSGHMPAQIPYRKPLPGWEQFF